MAMVRRIRKTKGLAPLPEDWVLAQPGTDLSYLAVQGELRPAYGVEHYVRSIVRALSRTDKASCALVGLTGTGKSAIVEQLAIEQAAGRLPEPIASHRIVRVSLQEIAGLQPPGQDTNDYWSYFSRLVHETRIGSVILFWDEFQAIFFWPVSCQTLKPYLARGELRVIAATTPAEFDRFVRYDPALERRFQVIPVAEPDAEQLRRILEGVASSLSARYQVAIERNVIEECIRLSRYLPQNQPDAAIDLLEIAAMEASESVAAN